LIADMKLLNFNLVIIVILVFLRFLEYCLNIFKCFKININNLKF
jgi:hypothetical protein